MSSAEGESVAQAMRQHTLSPVESRFESPDSAYGLTADVGIVAKALEVRDGRVVADKR